MSLLAERPHEAVYQYTRAVGEDSDDVARSFESAVEHFMAPMYQSTESLKAKFDRLASRWRTDTLVVSTVQAMTLHPAYQEIVGMGPEAVPLLLSELRRHPDHWFPALRAITGVDPVPTADRGNIKRMTEAWLTWGKDQQLIR